MTKQLDSDQLDYTLEGVNEYHLYIAHSLSDGVTASQISERLGRRNIKCFTRHDKGTEARSATIKGRIRDGVLCSRKCLVLLTESYVDDDWYKIEMEEVSTKGHRFSKDTVIIATSGKVEVPEALRDFEDLPFVESDEWFEALAAQVLKGK